MTIITEDYCSFETAKLLKEKGFDARCPMIYTADGEMLYTDVKHHNMYAVTNKQLEYYTDIIAPTLHMAMKWLREVHNIYLNINIRVILGQWAGYDVSVYTTDNDGFLNKNTPIKLKDNISYEEAVESSIKYILENLI